MKITRRWHKHGTCPLSQDLRQERESGGKSCDIHSGRARRELPER